LIDTRWEIGTHYGLIHDSLAQAAFQQVVFGSLIQIIPSFLLGSLTLVIMKNRKNLDKDENKTSDVVQEK
jgi:hypothetical protein